MRVNQRPKPGGWRLEEASWRAVALAALLFCSRAHVAVAGEPAATIEEIYAGGEGIAVIERSNRTRTAEIQVRDAVTSVVFTADGARAYVGTAGGKEGAEGRGGIYVLDRSDSQLGTKLTSEPVRELRLHPGGKELYALEGRAPSPEGAGKRKALPDQCRLRILDLAAPQGGTGTTVMAGVGIRDLAVSPDRKTAYFLVPSNDEVRVVALPDASPVGTIDLSGGGADDRRLAAAPARMVLDDSGAKVAVLLGGSAAWGVQIVDLDARRSRRVTVAGGSSPLAGRFLSSKRFLALAARKLVVLDLGEARVVQSCDLRETFTLLAVPPDRSEIFLGAPIPVRTPGARGGSLVEVRDGDSLALLTDVPVAPSLHVLEVSPTRPHAEEP